jgi:allantoinase
MKFDLVVRNSSVVRSTGVEAVDIGVLDGKIVEILAGLSGDATETIDAVGLHVFPGLIDSHVHFNEPGRTEWEGFATGSAALAAGGGTCFFEMPLNASPPTLDGKTFDAKRAAAEASSITDFALWGGLTPNNLDTLEELADRGVIGFKAFMSNSGIDEFSAVDDYTLYRGMKIAAERGLIVALHAENDSITSGLARAAIEAGRTTAGDYLASRPIVAEVEAIERAKIIAADTKCKLHIVHVSSQAGALSCMSPVSGTSGSQRRGRHFWRRESPASQNDADSEPLLDYSEREPDVSFETCPHYLWFTGDDVVRIGARAKCAPPVRSAADRSFLRSLLDTGGIAFVASDHSPSPASMKTDADFFKIWGGIAGVQSTLAVMLSIDLPVPLPTIADYIARNVAKRFGLTTKGSLEIGMDADFSLVSPEKSFTLLRDDLHDRHRLSPYIGETFRGDVHRTICRGRTLFLDGKITARGGGRFLRPGGPA